MTKKQKEQLRKLGREVLEKADIIICDEKCKSNKLLTSFSKYCAEHPQERFWQALRNWSGRAFILKANDYDFKTHTYKQISDTFYD